MDKALQYYCLFCISDFTNIAIVKSRLSFESSIVIKEKIKSPLPFTVSQFKNKDKL